MIQLSPKKRELYLPVHYGDNAALSASILQSLQCKAVVCRAETVSAQQTACSSLQSSSGAPTRVRDPKLNGLEYIPVIKLSLIQEPGAGVLVVGATGGVGQILTSRLAKVRAAACCIPLAVRLTGPVRSLACRKAIKSKPLCGIWAKQRRCLVMSAEWRCELFLS